MLRIVSRKTYQTFGVSIQQLFHPTHVKFTAENTAETKEQKTAPWNARFPVQTSNHSINFKMCHLYRLVIWASIGSLIFPNFETTNSACSLFWTLTPLNISGLLHRCNHRARCTRSPSHLARKTPPNSWMAPRCRLWPVACDWHVPSISDRCSCGLPEISWKLTVRLVLMENLPFYMYIPNLYIYIYIYAFINTIIVTLLSLYF